MMKSALIFTILLITTHCYAGELSVYQNISVSDENPKFSINVKEEKLESIRTAPKVLLILEGARLRSCKNNVAGVRLYYGRKPDNFILVKFTEYKFGLGAIKTEDISIDITNTLAKNIWYTTKFEAVPIYDNREDGCFSLTARRLVIKPVWPN